MATLVAVAACTEKLESGVGCPSLCPDQNVAVLDTVIEPIAPGFGTAADSGALDTTLTGFPGIGSEGSMLLADRILPNGDTLVSYGVVRFDSLLRRFTRAGGDSAVVAIDSAYLQIFIDTVSARRRVSGPVTIEAFDVDTTVASLADTSAATLRPLFRASRLLGSRTFPADGLRDTVKIPLSNPAILAKLTAEGATRLRVGLRATSAGLPVQLRIGTFEGGRAAVISYDPSPDTLVPPIRVPPFSSEPSQIAGLQNALADFTVLVDALRDAPITELQVGSLTGRRAFLRFGIPRAILDSSTIIRATLLLTQRPSPNAQPQDSVTILPSFVLATSRVPVGRAANVLDFTGNFGLDTLRLVAADSGVRAFEMVSVLRAWRRLSKEQLQMALVFRSLREGELPVEARFYSSEAAPALRPKLRISYVPSVQLGTR